MSVQFTSKVEKTRAEKRRSTWELLTTPSLVEAVHKARELGWEQNKVQVRFEKLDNIETYYVEPYEKNCGCRGMLKFDNYFNRSN